MRIETERLLLRRVEPSDAPELYEVNSDPTTFEYIGATPAASIDEMLERIAAKAAHQSEHGFSLWAVEERDSGRVVGECGLQMLEGGPQVEVGYRLARDARGRGYATEAARASLTYGFDQIGLERIVAVAAPANAASRRVMEKAGMTMEGPGRHYGQETVLYSITRRQAAAAAASAAPRPRR